MALLGPFSVGYPVAFKTGGDTTREAFGKHIQEIERIYGILNALDNGKVSADDLTNSFSSINDRLQQHIDSTNPHPNWKIKFSDITGDLDGSRLTGHIDASLIYGLLNNANIDANRVNGLEAFVKSLVGDGSGVGITEDDLSANGYVKFGNGLMLVWGTATVTLTRPTGTYIISSGDIPYSGTLSYHKPFSSMCIAMLKSGIVDCPVYMSSASTTSTTIPKYEAPGKTGIPIKLCVTSERANGLGFALPETETAKYYYVVIGV